jgi:hypothetical protein
MLAVLDNIIISYQVRNEYLAKEACIAASELKRWRYSLPVTTDPYKCETDKI